tara:strand:+ start:603 stop:1352 length:750 start_codon:yes stop_codon:yes gene_type:complete
MTQEKTVQFYEEEDSRGKIFQKLNNMRNAESEYNAELYNHCLIQNSGNNIYCDEEQEERFKDDARKIIKEKYENPVLPKIQTMEERILFIKDQNKYKNRVADVYSVYYNKYNDLKDKSQENNNKKNVNDRLAHYYNSKTSNLNSLLHGLRIIYWLSFVCVLILFVYKKQYKDKSYWPMVLSMLLFPFIFEHGIRFKVPFMGNAEYHIPSIFQYAFIKFKHFKLDNIYFISFTLIIGYLFLVNYISKMPF